MGSANILAIHALDDLKASLARFGGEAQDVMQSATQEIRRTLDWLAERLRYWQAEVRRRQERVAQARAALLRCQASGTRDPQTGRTSVPNCSAYEDALLQATLQLRQAEAELRAVQDWTRLVQQAAADYQRQAQQLAALIGGDLPKAEALLGRSADILSSYAAMAAPGVPLAALGQSPPPAQPVEPPPEPLKPPMPPESREGGSGGPERGG